MNVPRCQCHDLEMVPLGRGGADGWMCSQIDQRRLDVKSRSSRSIARPYSEIHAGVYFIAGGGHTKIGITRDVDRRLSQLQSACPVSLRIVYLEELPVNELHRAEKLYQRLHACLKQEHSHGDWFRGEMSESSARETVASVT